MSEICPAVEGGCEYDFDSRLHFDVNGLFNMQFLLSKAWDACFNTWLSE